MLNSKSQLGCTVTVRVLHSRVRCHGDQDLHHHGDTGDLSQGVGHRPGRCTQSVQVGDGVNRPSADEKQKVKAGHGQGGSRQGVDSPQEEEGHDVLHVVEMSSVGAEHTCFQYPAAL